MDPDAPDRVDDLGALLGCRIVSERNSSIRSELSRIFSRTDEAPRTPARSPPPAPPPLPSAPPPPARRRRAPSPVVRDAAVDVEPSLSEMRQLCQRMERLVDRLDALCAVGSVAGAMPPPPTPQPPGRGKKGSARRAETARHPERGGRGRLF